MLWCFSAYMQNMVKGTKECAYYCSQTYFLEFIPLAHWLLFLRVYIISRRHYDTENMHR